MSRTLLPWIFVLLFGVLFPLFWCGVCYIIGRFGGWHRLAQSYTTTQTPLGTMFYIGQFELDASRYRGALVGHVADAGLYLSPIFLFRPGHPTLLIPWMAVRSLRTEKMLWLTGYAADIVTKNGELVTATFYDQRLAQAIGDQAAKVTQVAR